MPQAWLKAQAEYLEDAKLKETSQSPDKDTQNTDTPQSDYGYLSGKTMILPYPFTQVENGPRNQSEAHTKASEKTKHRLPNKDLPKEPRSPAHSLPTISAKSAGTRRYILQDAVEAVRSANTVTERMVRSPHADILIIEHDTDVDKPSTGKYSRLLPPIGSHRSSLPGVDFNMTWCSKEKRFVKKYMLNNSEQQEHH